MNERENKTPTDLLRLIQENPELPIVPMVDGEIAEDDGGYWLGAWGVAHVDEYLIARKRVIFKSDDDVFDTLERFMSDAEFAALPEAENECRLYYDQLPWIKAIVVYITLPK